MKKSLIAFAALAAVAGVAQAQSVTLYGIMDAGVVNQSGGASAGTKTAFASGLASTSRWGLKGTEDLGGGMNAGFQLESELALSTGASAGNSANEPANGGATQTSVLFHRAANVSLSGNFGSFTLGRQDRLEYVNVAKYDATGASNFGGLVRAGYIGNSTAGSTNIAPMSADARLNSAVAYATPVVNGLSAGVQYALGGQAGDMSLGSSTQFRLGYDAGNLSIAATTASDNSLTGGQVAAKTTTVGASYDFGSFKGYAAHLQRNITATNVTSRVEYVGIRVPVTSSLAVVGNYMNITGANGSSAARASVLSASAFYSLSKTVTTYAMIGTATNNSSSNVYVTNQASNTQGYSPTAVGVGMRYVF